MINAFLIAHLTQNFFFFNKKTLIEEDRLLSRIDYLEKQLILASKVKAQQIETSLVFIFKINFLFNLKTQNDESLFKNINALRDEKLNIENTAKVSKNFKFKIRNERKNNFNLFFS